MGCNESKNGDSIEMSRKKPKNKDQALQQRESHRIVREPRKKSKDELKTATKEKMAGVKIEKHVRFEEPIPNKEKIIAMEEAESEAESFHSTEEEINTQNEK